MAICAFSTKSWKASGSNFERIDMTATNKVSEIIEQVREENGLPMLYIAMKSPDGAVMVTSTSRGKASYLDGYAKNGQMKLHLKYESIGNNGRIEYFDNGMAFDSRFGGEIHSLFIPYDCVVGLELDNGDIVDLRKPMPSKNNALMIPPLVIRKIVDFVDAKYPGLPIIAGISEVGSERSFFHQVSSASFGDDGTLYFGSGISDWIIEMPKDLSTEALDCDQEGEDLKVVFTHLFCPPENSPFMTNGGHLAIIDSELGRHIAELVKEFNPMTTVTTGAVEEGHVVDSTVDSSPVLFSVSDVSKVVELLNGVGDTKRPVIGDTTEMSSGNVTAVDFRSRKVLK